MTWPRMASVTLALVLSGGGTGIAAQDADLAAARSAYSEGAYARAARLLDRLAGRSVEAARLAVRVRLVTGEYERAEILASGALERHPDDPDLLTGRGLARKALGRRDPALTDFRRAGDASLEARYHLYRSMLDRGSVAEAMTGFDRFIDTYNRGTGFTSNDLVAIASAARELGRLNSDLLYDARRVYDEAITRDPGNLDARVALATLFLDTYNNADASQVLREALAMNAQHPGALLAMARSHHFDGSPEAMTFVERSLDANPNHVLARTFRARLLLESEQYDEAADELRRALEVNAQSLEALSVRATVEFLRGNRQGFERDERSVLSLNARYADLYIELAELTARNRLYREAEAFATRAVALDSLSWRGWGVRGMNELRNGKIEEGRRHLERAFAGDPFNVWIKNTLDLTDTFDEYRVVETPRFRIALHESEWGVLEPYVTTLAEEAFDRLSARYDYAPPTPIRLEVYPRHADFSVRTVGLAGMGALGVSFGSTLAMDSPSARDRGDFNWGSTLWHEIAHAFHLGLTEHRVPRWFTEGLAVFEERQAYPGWGDDVNPAFLQAYREDRLHSVSTLNDGFVRPDYPAQVVFSYYQASLVCELIEREWGRDALTAMLHGFREGHGTDAVIERVTGLTPESLDRRFDAFMRERFTRALVALEGDHGATGPERVARAVTDAERSPGSYRAQMRAGEALMSADRGEEALPFLERAKQLLPEYAGAGSPYWHLAQLHVAGGRRRDAIRELVSQTAINESHYEAFALLATLWADEGDLSRAADVLSMAMYIYPMDASAHVLLAEWYEALDQWPQAVRERQVLVMLDPVDMAEARYRLAFALFRSGDRRAARREVLRSLEIAPNYREAQDLLLTLRAPPTSNGEGREW